MSQPSSIPLGARGRATQLLSAPSLLALCLSLLIGTGQQAPAATTIDLGYLRAEHTSVVKRLIAQVRFDFEPMSVHVCPDGRATLEVDWKMKDNTRASILDTKLEAKLDILTQPTQAPDTRSLKKEWRSGTWEKRTRTGDLRDTVRIPDDVPIAIVLVRLRARARGRTGVGADTDGWKSRPLILTRPAQLDSGRDSYRYTTSIARLYCESFLRAGMLHQWLQEFAQLNDTNRAQEIRSSLGEMMNVIYQKHYRYDHWDLLVDLAEPISAWAAYTWPTSTTAIAGTVLAEVAMPVHFGIEMYQMCIAIRDWADGQLHEASLVADTRSVIWHVSEDGDLADYEIPRSRSQAVGELGALADLWQAGNLADARSAWEAVAQAAAGERSRVRSVTQFLGNLLGVPLSDDQDRWLLDQRETDITKTALWTTYGNRPFLGDLLNNAASKRRVLQQSQAFWLALFARLAGYDEPQLQHLHNIAQTMVDRVLAPPQTTDTHVAAAIRNGDFTDGLNEWQTSTPNEPADSIAQIRTVHENFGHALQLRREKSRNWGRRVAVSQDLNVDLTGLEKLHLEADVKPIFASLPDPGGGGGAEYPIGLSLLFEDNQGDGHLWIHGFYYRDLRTQWDHDTRVARSRWYHYSSPNFAGGLRLHDRHGRAFVPGKIKRISVYGQGWDFKGRATNIRLTASPSPSGQVD